MKTDDFEKQFQQVAPREIPSTWRKEILAAARNAEPKSERAMRRHNSLALIRHWLSSPMLRQRTALAGLAAAWLVIVALNLATKASQPPAIAQGKPQPLTPETLQLLKQQRLLYAELAGPAKQSLTYPPTPALPGPRSQRREETFTV